jgi:hypothetical protein
MPIVKPSSLPTWATEALDVVEPSLGKKAQGWLSGERLTAGMLNWMFRHFAQWVQWMFVGSARTLPWQNPVNLTVGIGAGGAHRAVAALQSTTAVGVMVLLESFVEGEEGWYLRTCDPFTSDWSNTAIATDGGATVGMFRGLAASADRFVIVGDGGRIQTYESGAWTKRSAAAGFTGDFHDVLWDGQQFVAIGGNFEVQTSPDGLSWTRRASTAPVGGPSPMASFAAIASGGARLVRGGVDSAGHAALWYSDDGGTTWHWAHSSSLSAPIGKVIGALSIDGTPTFAAQTNSGNPAYLSILGSTGGIEWTTAPLPPSEGWGLRCAYNDMLVATFGRHVSVDGLNWHLMPFPGNDSMLRHAAVSPQGWAILSLIGDGGDVIARTPIQRWF